jgi:hypothetical protein
MEFLAVLIIAVCLPVAAWKGKGIRGFYVALCIVGLLVAMGFSDIAGDLARKPQSTLTPDEVVVGIKFFSFVMLVGVGLFFGGLFGSCVYRKKAA